MSFAYALSIAPRMLDGLVTTLLLLLGAWLLGCVLAVGAALARTSRSATLRGASWTYMQAIRGTPLLVQMYLFYYGLGSVFSGLPALRASVFWPVLREGFCYAVIALGISAGAYTGEILRGAILAVPKGEVEAGRALGLPPRLITWLIVLPRAVQANLPTLAGETIILMKSTALASSITVLDVMGQANFARAQSLRVYEPLLFAAVVYIGLTLVIAQLFALAERRFDRQRAPVVRGGR